MSGDALSGLRRLVAIMHRLRDPVAGCEWDIAQTSATIAPYTIEEAYEVADAIARGDLPALVDELGDLQLQVVFHATIAEQAGQFTLADVLASISDKLERRHPHIFGDGSTAGWEELKAAERTALADSSALAGIPIDAPALMRAQKLQARAARIGFDWSDAIGARDKVVEELAEVDAAANEHERRDEVGDLLFAAVNLARKHGVDAEDALRQASRKFEARFRWMEAAEPSLASKSLDEQEALWKRAKAALRLV
jgi:ATP diphosphatase